MYTCTCLRCLCWIHFMSQWKEWWAVFRHKLWKIWVWTFKSLSFTEPSRRLSVHNNRKGNICVSVSSTGQYTRSLLHFSNMLLLDWREHFWKMSATDICVLTYSRSRKCLKSSLRDCDTSILTAHVSFSGWEWATRAILSDSKSFSCSALWSGCH